MLTSDKELLIAGKNAGVQVLDPMQQETLATVRRFRAAEQ